MAIKTTEIKLGSLLAPDAGGNGTNPQALLLEDTNIITIVRVGTENPYAADAFQGAYVNVYDDNNRLRSFGYVTKYSAVAGTGYEIDIQFQSDGEAARVYPLITDSNPVILRGLLQFESEQTVPTGEAWTLQYVISSNGFENTSLRANLTVNNILYEWLVKNAEDGPVPEGTRLYSENFTGQEILIVYDDGL